MAATAAQQNPFTNVQWEFLKLFEYHVSDEQLSEIKDLLVKYFAQKIDNEMDILWEQNQCTTETVEQWANGHDRIGSKTK
jgi:hypothetical protein